MESTTGQQVSSPSTPAADAGDARVAKDVALESRTPDLSISCEDNDRRVWDRDATGTGITFNYNVMTAHKCLWDAKHEERPERFTAVYDRFVEYDLISRCKVIEGRPATTDELLTIHDEEYVRKVAATSGLTDEVQLESIASKFDAVYFNPSTYEAALLSAGSAIELVSAVVQDKVRNGFALIRPPGHHAMRSESCGFCFFNNVAVAAQHALQHESVQRILIVDWDVHHGQATQQSFISDPRVMYVSIHRYEDGTFWPGLIESDYHMVGTGPGIGFNVNIPLNCTGINDRDYLSQFHNIILPLGHRFDPDLVLVSAGYDAAFGCPEGEMRLSPAVYGHMTHALMSLAEGRVVALLEGGYCLESLAESAAMTLKALLSDPIPEIVALATQKIHQPLLESALNVIYAHRPHHPDLFVMQREFDRRSDQETSGGEDFFRIRHYPLVNYRGTVSLKPKPEFYDTRDTCPVQPEEVRANLVQEISLLREKTQLNNRFIGKKRTGISFSDFHKKHKCSVAHPERPSRAAAILKRLTTDGLMDRSVVMQSHRLATDEEIRLVHTEEYLNSVKRIKTLSPEKIGSYAAKEDSIYLTAHSEEAARASTGALLSLVDAVMTDEVLNGFAVIRPPGHHAHADKMAGFCIFNNIAIAARYLADKYKQERILIVDCDVHHGDGTQSIVKGDPNVLFISIHRYEYADFYPGSLEAGITTCPEDNIVNIPFNNNSMNENEYLSTLFNLILPIATDFRPQVVLLSAGFDAASKDPLGEYSVSPVFFGHLTHHLMSLSGGRVIAALEGGYNLTSISRAAANCVAALNGLPLPRLPVTAVDDGAQQVMREVNDFHKSHFPSLVFGVDLPINTNVDQRPADETPVKMKDSSADTKELERQFAQLFNSPETSGGSNS